MHIFKTDIRWICCDFLVRYDKKNYHSAQITSYMLPLGIEPE